MYASYLCINQCFNVWFLLFTILDLLHITISKILYICVILLLRKPHNLTYICSCFTLGIFSQSEAGWKFEGPLCVTRLVFEPCKPINDYVNKPQKTAGHQAEMYHCQTGACQQSTSQTKVSCIMLLCCLTAENFFFFCYGIQGVDPGTMSYTA